MADIMSGGWLSGKKTHLLSVGTIITAVIGYLVGVVDLTLVFEAVAASGFFSFLRLGVSKAANSGS